MASKVTEVRKFTVIVLVKWLYHCTTVVNCRVPKGKKNEILTIKKCQLLLSREREQPAFIRIVNQTASTVFIHIINVHREFTFGTLREFMFCIAVQ